MSCQICHKTEKVSKCSRCKMAFYCSEDHQQLDFKTHKKYCVKIKKTTIELNNQERYLREMPADFSLPENVFEEGAGHFWGIMETRDYMRARGQVIASLDGLGTITSLQAELVHSLDCFRLCRSDNMGFRFLTPAVFLRLDKVQECYDFIKWWCTCDPDGRYDWGNTSLPYLNIRNANMLEPIDFFGKYTCLSFLVSMTLIKYIIYKELVSLQTIQQLNSKLPSDLVEEIKAKSRVYTPKVLASSLEDTIKQVQEQLTYCFDTVDAANVHLWPALFNPKRMLAMGLPTYTSAGDVTDVQGIFAGVYEAWKRIPGAIDYVKEIYDR
ncbi:hypothetical protein BC833DRAFT_613537 [Globomyces pollinis-pini]|nr:hypothetical protein BC833DRAFT_613537 [Globomyces pollinis-pini]